MPIKMTFWKKQKITKIDYLKLSQEKGGIKPYIRDLNLPDARLNFAIRSKMTKTVQMNYKGIEKFKKNHWKCVKCGVPDTQEHVIKCPEYEQLRFNKDLKQTKLLVEYFRKVISIRESCM